jgi:hypothetical protein
MNYVCSEYDGIYKEVRKSTIKAIIITLDLPLAILITQNASCQNKAPKKAIFGKMFFRGIFK